MNTFNYKFIDLSFNLSYSFGGYSYDNASTFCKMMVIQ